jgi:putative hydrolase of the HAD superfamily
MAIRAVLWDVGGPLDTEVEAERYIDAQIQRMVKAAGVTVTDESYADANRWAVASFASNTYKAIVWRLCGGDRSAVVRVGELSFPERPFEMRAGIDGVLARLHHRGILLGLAANQPSRIIGVLDELGIGQYFNHRQMSGHHGYRKPDVRLFLRACEDLGVAAGECVMVGDRIDNDIAPARVLGMRTVLLRTGRHIDQQLRSLDEVPDFEVRTVEELETALTAIIEPA